MRTSSLVFAILVTVSSPLAAQLAITNGPLPFGGVNQGYSAQLTTNGGEGSYTWSFTGGALPPGLTLNTEDGAITGAPTTPGIYPFTIKVVENEEEEASPSATRSFSISVMEISTPSQLPAASTCALYSETFAVADGPPPPYIWSFSDSIAPQGLSLNSTNGILSGKPTTDGHYEFSIQASSSSGGVSATANFALTVAGLCFLTTTLPGGDLNTYYRESLVVTGGAQPLGWSIKNGTLPTGVSLDKDTGLLSGIPTALGTFNFTVQVTDADGVIGTQAFTVTINAALAFTTTSPLPPGMVGVNYSQTFAATGGLAPYTFTTADPPTGLTLSSTGVLSGMPSAGVFPFQVTVTDSVNVSVLANFQLTVTVPGPVVQVSPTSLSFTAPFEGDAPAPQYIDVVPVGTQPVNIQVSVDGGAGVPAPSWITVTPVTGTAPVRLVVSVNQGTLATQTSTARVQVIDPNGNGIVVTVTLNIVSAAPRLQVVPDTLHFSALSSSPGTLVQTLGIRSIGGGGPLSYTTFIQNNSSWITSVSPSSGQTVPNSTVFLQVQINTQGLAVGSYHDVILFSSTAATVSVPIALFVSASGAIQDLSVTGIRFQAIQNGGFSNVQTVQILDVGEPGTSLSWTADFVSGSQYFTASATGGAASRTNPGSLTLTPTASALQNPPGGYYALLEITSAALNSPLYVVLVLDLAPSGTPPLPDPSPAGLTFNATAGAALATGQTISVNTSSTTAVSFQVAVVTAGGGNWLTATPVSGTSTGQTPGQVTVTVDATQLAAGIYSGEVDISMSGALRSVNIIVIVEPPTGAAGREAPRATLNCTPAALAITETALVNNFAIPAGWPAALNIQLNDDCGNPISNGSVSASFSNGDPPLMLRGEQAGSYDATWQPGVVSPQLAVTIQAQAGTLKPALAELTGTINANQNAPPSLAENGTVNTFNRVPAGALSPGMIVEVYGTGLATVMGNTSSLPLPTSFGGTSLIVGPYQAPLYYVSGNQVNVEFAAELVPNQQYPVIAMLNGALSVPVLTDIVPDQLGVAANSDGTVIAQHGANSTYVTANSPAQPGEVLVIYLSGMGPTDPAVKSGTPAPGSPNLAKVTIAPTVSVEGQAANVQFAGLSPGLVGLYQVNFQVPANAGTGQLTLMVSQNGVSSNVTRLYVAK